MRSVHVNGNYETTERNWDTVEVLVDECVKTKEDTVKLGIMAGDYVCFEPRTRVTASGYIKSRFLDDKLSAAILLAYGRYLKEEKVVPERHVYAHFTIYEEVGHGGSASVPEALQRPGRWIWAVWETDLPVRSMRFRSVQRTAGAPTIMRLSAGWWSWRRSMGSAMLWMYILIMAPMWKPRSALVTTSAMR